MANISNNGIITIHKGDDLDYTIFINKGTKLEQVPYLLVPGDTIYISICEAEQPFECGLIRKKLIYSDFDKEHQAHLVLTPTDTEHLKAGLYYYEIKIKLSNDKIATIVPRQRFIILE